MADVETIHAAPLGRLLCGIFVAAFAFRTNSFLFRPPPLDLVALTLLLLACPRKKNLPFRARLDDGCQTRLQGPKRENVLLSGGED
jgi:hypothetical protein